MKGKIVLLPGDGIGPEVVSAACAVLERVAQQFGHDFITTEQAIGGFAMDTCGDSLPAQTISACHEADAILLGAVGGPKWDNPLAADRPERGLLGIRKSLTLFANLRPVKVHPSLIDSSPIKADRLQGVDLLVVRELTGGLYFGEPRLRRKVNGEDTALDTMTYTEGEIERVARLAFELARGRKKKVTSVDKANVIECSRLWRQTVTRVSADYPDITLEHLLVDAAAMHLITRPATFDVMVTENLFGDILTDEASVLSGSMGNLPSASLGNIKNSFGKPRGLYEPIHGSAPDIAGKGIANPIGTIISAAMMLRYSFGLEQEAQAVENAVDIALRSGARTGDLASKDEKALSTNEMCEKIIGNL
ncbi:MAG: 3-isopropylmalate dehydrogenase [Chloroflexota bacterium]